jgi:hypothetical protein
MMNVRKILDATGDDERGLAKLKKGDLSGKDYPGKDRG